MIKSARSKVTNLEVQAKDWDKPVHGPTGYCMARTSHDRRAFRVACRLFDGGAAEQEYARELFADALYRVSRHASADIRREVCREAAYYLAGDVCE